MNADQKREVNLLVVGALLVGFLLGLWGGHNQSPHAAPVVASTAHAGSRFLAVYVDAKTGGLYAENGYGLGITLMPMKDRKAIVDAAMAKQEGLEK